MGRNEVNVRLSVSDGDLRRRLAGDVSLLDETGSSGAVAGKRIDSSFEQAGGSVEGLSSSIERQSAVVEDLRRRYEESASAASAAFGDKDRYEELLSATRELRREYEEQARVLAGLRSEGSPFPGSADDLAGIRSQLRGVTNELAGVTLRYREMSKEERNSASGKALKAKMEELIRKAGNLRDALDDVNRSVRGTASDTKNFDAIAGGMNVAMSAAGAATSVFEMFGAKQEDLVNIQTKLQATLAISNALSVIQNNLQKESALMIGIRTIQEKAQAAAIAVRSAAEGKGVIVTGLATAAQKAFNLVAKANPYVLLATAILGVGAALIGFSKKTKEATELEKQQQEELEQERKAAEEWKKSIADAAGQVSAKFKLLETEWKNLKTTAEKTEWIEKNKSEFSQMGVVINNVSDAEMVFVKNTEKMLEAFKLRAEAAAWEQKLIDAYGKRVDRARELQLQAEIKRNAALRNAGEQIKGDEVSRYGLIENQDYTHKDGQVGMFFTVQGAAKVNKGIQETANRTADVSNDPQIRALDNEIDGYVKAITGLRQKVADLIPKTSAPLSSSKTTNTQNKSNSKATPTKPGKTKPDVKDYTDEIEARREAYRKGAEQLSKDARDNELAIREAQIKAKEDGIEKELELIALEYDKQENENLKRRDEMIEKLQEQEENLWRQKHPDSKEKFKTSITKDMLSYHGEEAKPIPKGLNPEIVTQMKEMQNQLTSFYELANQQEKKAIETAYHDQYIAMQEFLAEYGSYEEQLTAIKELYADKRAKAQTEGERKALVEQENAAISEVNLAWFKKSSEYLQSMGNLSAYTRRELEKLKQSLRDRMGSDGLKDNAKALELIRDAIERIEKQQKSLTKPFKTSYDEIRDILELEKAIEAEKSRQSDLQESLKRKTEELVALQEKLNRLKQAGSGAGEGEVAATEQQIKETSGAIEGLNGQLGESAGRIGEMGSQMQGMAGGAASAVAVVDKIVHTVSDTIKAVIGMFNDLKETAASFGADTESGGWSDATIAFNAIGEMNEHATQGWEALKSGNIAGAVQHTIGSITSIVRGFNALHDNQHEKRIKKLQERVKDLQKGYEDLERAVAKSYSKAKQSNIGLEIESKQEQVALLKESIQEERDKKKTDKGRIEEWEDEIRSLEYEIEDLRASAIDALFGEDVQTAIDNFAGAWADAWSSGEDRVKSARDTVKGMMKQMVTESLKSAMASSGALESIRRKLEEFYADEVLSGWEQDYIMGMAEDLQRVLDEQFGWAGGLLSDKAGTSQNGSSRGFETMSQDQASELSGRFTGVQLSAASIDVKLDAVIEQQSGVRSQIAQMSEGLSALVELHGVGLSHLEAIERNTRPLSEMNDRLGKIERNTRNL